jgi:hypothetical protein
MGLLGILGMLVFGVWLVVSGEDCCAYKRRYKLIILGLFLLSIFIIIYDYTSPVYIKESREFMTNDYQTYELNIDNDDLGLVEEREICPTRKLASIGIKTEYYFMGFVEQGEN